MATARTRARTDRTSQGRPDEMQRRFGAIGIPAVAAALEMMKRRAPRGEARRELPPVLRDRD